jgi:hypothetical protein
MPTHSLHLYNKIEKQISLPLTQFILPLYHNLNITIMDITAVIIIGIIVMAEVWTLIKRAVK